MKFRSIIRPFKNRFIDSFFEKKKEEASTSEGQHLLHALSEEEKLVILDKVFPHQAAPSTLVNIDCPVSTPSEEPFLLRGWIASSQEIKDAWLISSPDTKLEFEMRPDVAKLFPAYQFVKGFFAEWKKNLLERPLS